MARRPLITHPEALAVTKRLLDIAMMSDEEQKGLATAVRAGEVLLRAFQTQERYALDQQTPADFARAAKNPKTRAAELDRLTQDDLLALQAKLTTDFPGKPA